MYSVSFYKPVTSGIKVFDLLRGGMYIPASLTLKEAYMLPLESLLSKSHLLGLNYCLINIKCFLL